MNCFRRKAFARYLCEDNFPAAIRLTTNSAIFTSSMIDAEIIDHVEYFSTVWSLSAASRALQIFLH